MRNLIDTKLLRKLWPLPISDKELEARLGHRRGALRRRAIQIGLPTSRRALWAKNAKAELTSTDRRD